MFYKGHTIFLQDDDVTSLHIDVFALRPLMFKNYFLSMNVFYEKIKCVCKWTSVQFNTVWFSY